MPRILDFARKLFSFQGRLRRRDLWLFTIVFIAVMLPLRMMLTKALGWPYLDVRMTWCLLALNAWPSTAVMVTRLHDRDLSGWWAGPAWAWSVYVDVEPYLTLSPRAALALKIIYHLGGLGVFVLLFCLDGTKGANRFGPSPKGLE